MTTHTIYQTQKGEVTLMTNPGCAPVVFLNGVIQQPGTYSLSGTNVIFDSPPLHSEWKPWFAWRPVRVNGKWYWFKQVYRQHLLSPGSGVYRYGDDFDVLKETK